jgi:hypothetical protein
VLPRAVGVPPRPGSVTVPVRHPRRTLCLPGRRRTPDGIRLVTLSTPVNTAFSCSYFCPARLSEDAPSRQRSSPAGEPSLTSSRSHRLHAAPRSPYAIQQSNSPGLASTHAPPTRTSKLRLPLLFRRPIRHSLQTKLVPLRGEIGLQYRQRRPHDQDQCPVDRNEADLRVPQSPIAG